MTAYGIELALYSGVPRTAGHNLAPTGASLLSDLFCRKRLDRQRLGRILLRQTRPDRFDLLTLLFLIHTADPDASEEANAGTQRVCRFIEEANALLTSCGLWELYQCH